MGGREAALDVSGMGFVGVVDVLDEGGVDELVVVGVNCYLVVRMAYQTSSAGIVVVSIETSYIYQSTAASTTRSFRCTLLLLPPKEDVEVEATHDSHKAISIRFCRPSPPAQDTLVLAPPKSPRSDYA